MPNDQVDSLQGDVDPPVLRKITDTNNDNEVRDSIPPFKRRKTLDFQDVSAEEVYESDNSQRSSSKSRRNRGRPKSRTNSDPKPQTMSEWGFDLWNVNLQIKSVTKERFILFLRSLRRENNNIKCKYVNVGQQIFMTTKTPEDIKSILVEVRSSIPSSNTSLVTKYAFLLNQVKSFLELEQDNFPKIQAQLDDNYRSMEWQSFCRLNKIPVADQDSYKTHFFNIKW